MRSLPTLLLLIGAACSGAGRDEQPKSGAPTDTAAAPVSAAPATGKPTAKPAGGDGFTSGPLVAASPASPVAEEKPMDAESPPLDHLPEIRRLERPEPVAAGEIRRLNSGGKGAGAPEKP